MTELHYKKVSVVMCTYNGEKYIREQIDSIIKQTYPIYELIIRDDGSTDATCSIIKEYQLKYPFIKLINSGKHLGVNDNFYKVMKMANGDYIAFSDQDDIWHHEKIEEQVKAIGDACMCAHESRSFKGDKGGFSSFDPRPRNYSLLRILFSTAFAGHTIMISRKFRDEVSFITVSACPYGTWDAVLAIAAGAKNSIVFLNKVLVEHRRLGNSLTNIKDYDSKNNVLLWCLRNFKDARAVMRWAFNDYCNLLLRIQSDDPIYKEGLLACKYVKGKGLINYIHYTLFCLKHKSEITYTNSNNALKQAFRAILFPITSCWYFRIVVKRKQEEKQHEP